MDTIPPPEFVRLLAAARAYVVLTSHHNKMWTREEMEAVRYELREALEEFIAKNQGVMRYIATVASIVQIAA